jgi:hypothetical protein
MPLLSFSVLKDKLLDGSKTQTIRVPRKHPLKVGDKLYIYWKCRTKETEKLGEGIITGIDSKPIFEVTAEQARKDGFVNFQEFVDTWVRLHPKGHADDYVDVVTWKWTLGGPLSQRVWSGSK